MKILVTGGSGRAGRHVVASLVSAGHEVVNVDRTALPGLEAPTIRIDLEDLGSVYDAFAQVEPEGVCHLAAQPEPFGFSRAKTFVGNTAITYHVMQVAGEAGVRRFISAGSEMATGWLTTVADPPQFPFDESARVDSPNAYALSKYLSEVLADSFIQRFPEMPIVTLRINNVIPPEESEQMLAPRRATFPGPGAVNYWSYIDARDVGSAFRAALEGTSAGHEVYLIAAADTCIEVPTQEALTRLLGKDPGLPDGFPEFGSVFNSGKMKEHFGWEAAHSWRD